MSDAVVVVSENSPAVVQTSGGAPTVIASGDRAVIAGPAAAPPIISPDSNTAPAILVTGAPGGGGGVPPPFEIEVADEGALEGVAGRLNFVGAGISVSFSGSIATVTVPGGTAGAIETVTLADDGSGSASGTAYDGSSPLIISYNSIGAQPVDADLSAIAALTTMPFGRSVLEMADAAAARSLLGLGTAATQPATAFLTPSANLSDLASASTARANLGLGYFATGTDASNLTGTVVAARIASNSLSYAKLTQASAASIFGTTAAGDHADLTPAQAKTVLAITTGDVSGLGTVATLAADADVTLAADSDGKVPTQKAVKAYVDASTGGVGALLAANNLSDLASVTTARTNLGLASIAASGSAADLVAGTIPAARMPALTGDVTTTAGAVATSIAAGAVTLAKMANLAANSILGNNTGAAATPIALTAAQTRTLLGLATVATSANAADLTAGTLPAARMPALTGDVTTTAGAVATTIAANAVGLTKMADVATGTVFYRKTAGTGDPEVQTLATLKADLGLTGTNSGDQTITLTGDVTGSGTGSFAATIGNNKVTLAKLATQAAGTILGNNSASAAVPSALTPAQVKTLLAYTSSDISFLQSGTGAVSRSTQDKIRDLVSVKDFGTVGDGATDDTAAVQAAINSGARFIYFPAGTYKLTATLFVTTPVILHGDGQGASILLQTNATADGVYFNYSVYTQGGGVRDLSIRAGAATNTGTGSTGAGLRMRKANGGFSSSCFDVQAFAYGVRVAEFFYAKFSDFQVLYAQNAGFLVDEPAAGGSDSAGLFVRDAKLSNFGFTGTNTSSVGIDVRQASGDYWDTVDITSFNTGVRLKPVTAGKSVRYLMMTKVLGDTSAFLNWDIDASIGPVVANEFLQCWSSNSQGSGVRFSGTSLEAQRWLGGWIRDSRQHGVELNAGNAIAIIGAEITRNSAAANNTYNGVNVAANVSGWRIENCTIGNVSTTVATSTQLSNIAIAAGFSDNFVIVGNDLRAWGTGGVPIANGTTSLAYIIRDNLPVQTAGVNNDRGVSVRGVSLGTVAAGTTAYMGPNGAQANEGDAYLMMDKPGVATQLIVEVDTAPGASQSFTYTVRKNNVDTGMTGAISGASSFQLISVAGQFDTSPTDRLSLKIVTSVGAAAARHRWALTIEP